MNSHRAALEYLSSLDRVDQVDLNLDVNLKAVVMSWAHRSGVSLETEQEILQCYRASASDNWVPARDIAPAVYDLFDQIEIGGRALYGTDPDLILPLAQDITPHYPRSLTTLNTNWGFMGVLPPLDLCMNAVEEWLQIEAAELYTDYF